MLSGTALEVAPETGNRVVCYCDDCHAFACYLGRNDILDVHGGTDIFQLTPAQVRITHGLDQLRVLRLTPTGLLRWYAGCCKTPIANTPTSARVPFVSLIHAFMDHAGDGRPRDAVLGPIIATGLARTAPDRPPADAALGVPLRVVLRNIRMIGLAWLAGKQQPSPFFDARRVVAREPTVLTGFERQRLRVATWSSPAQTPGSGAKTRLKRNMRGVRWVRRCR